jgi:hypothetical protein
MDEQRIISAFPRLKNDSRFRISSHKDINYNCIAWAGLHNDEYWWPEIVPYNKLDGVKYKWPFNLRNNDNLEYFIELFLNLGYKEETDNIENEHPKYRKIALFIKANSNISDRLNCKCTHAARQLKNGLWASKLGCSHDIEHSNPYDLEGQQYGQLAIILKKNLL